MERDNTAAILDARIRMALAKMEAIGVAILLGISSLPLGDRCQECNRRCPLSLRIIVLNTWRNFDGSWVSLNSFSKFEFRPVI
jgi:hypothetical protein